jgi:hypothetical protein
MPKKQPFSKLAASATDEDLRVDWDNSQVREKAKS